MSVENLIYHKGRPVGIDCGSYISWFPGAAREVIEQLKIPGTERVAKGRMK